MVGGGQTENANSTSTSANMTLMRLVQLTKGYHEMSHREGVVPNHAMAISVLFQRA